MPQRHDKNADPMFVACRVGGLQMFLHVLGVLNSGTLLSTTLIDAQIVTNCWKIDGWMDGWMHLTNLRPNLIDFVVWDNNVAE